jgi:hypothetical protein
MVSAVRAMFMAARLAVALLASLPFTRNSTVVWAAAMAAASLARGKIFLIRHDDR